MEVRSFTSRDYLGYDGAESLPDNSPPLIGEIEAPDGDYYTILVTGNEGRSVYEGNYNVSVHIIVAPATEDSPGEEWWYTDRATEASAILTANFLLNRPGRNTLSLLGFKAS